MNEEAIRRIVRQEIQSGDSASRFQQRGVQRHLHTGLDSPRIKAVDLIYNNKVLTGLTLANTGLAISSGTYLFQTPVSNLTQIIAMGFFRSPVAGTATTKTSFQGNAQIGSCTSQTSFTQASTQILQIIQMSSGSQYEDPGTGTYAPFVFTNGTNIGATRSANNGRINIVSVKANLITILVTLDPDWSVSFNLMFM